MTNQKKNNFLNETSEDQDPKNLVALQNLIKEKVKSFCEKFAKENDKKIDNILEKLAKEDWYYKHKIGKCSFAKVRFTFKDTRCWVGFDQIDQEMFFALPDSIWKDICSGIKEAVYPVAVRKIGTADDIALVIFDFA